MNKTTVLLIDDSPAFVDLITAYSANLPIELHVAETGTQASEMLRTQRFDAVLMDYNLPDMSGAELLRAVRHRELLNDMESTPVFALTDLSDIDATRNMLFAGCTALVGKPMSRQNFFSLIGHVRQRAQSAA